jgi:Zn-finger protein
MLSAMAYATARVKSMEDWHGKKYAFFNHRECEAFPCHASADPDSFNCLFCYCPLYLTGDDCGGRFTYTQSGVKSCMDCTVPHDLENYGYITDRAFRWGREHL